jgi:hypothetical protein
MNVFNRATTTMKDCVRYIYHEGFFLIEWAEHLVPYSWVHYFYSKENLLTLTRPSQGLCERIVDNRANLIQYIKNPSEKICVFAIKRYAPLSLLKNPSDELIKFAAIYSEENVNDISNPSEKLLWDILHENPAAISYIKYPTRDMWRWALTVRGDLLTTCDQNNSTYVWSDTNLCRIALENDDSMCKTSKGWVLRDPYSHMRSAYSCVLGVENVDYETTLNNLWTKTKIIEKMNREFNK